MINFVKWILFISSYIPLFIILIIKNIDLDASFKAFKYLFIYKDFTILKNISFEDIYLWFLIILSLTCIMIIKILFIQVCGFSKEITIKEIETNNNSILEYFVTYILTLSTSGFSIRDIIIFWIILYIIGTLYIKNNMFHVNPTLHLGFKYNIYKVKYSNNPNLSNLKDCFILSKLNEYEFNSYLNKSISINSLAEGLNKNIYLQNK